jgi:negative regulator of sigma E activity
MDMAVMVSAVIVTMVEDMAVVAMVVVTAEVVINSITNTINNINSPRLPVHQ